MCGVSRSYGAHQPSATTCPCLTSMKLFMVSISLSAASINARRSAEEMPCCSGVLRGSDADFCASKTGARTKQRRRTTLACWRRFISVCVSCGLVCQIDGQHRNEQPEQALHQKEKEAPEAESFNPERRLHT